MGKRPVPQAVKLLTTKQSQGAPRYRRLQPPVELCQQPQPGCTLVFLLQRSEKKSSLRWTGRDRTYQSGVFILFSMNNKNMHDFLFYKLFHAHLKMLPLPGACEYSHGRPQGRNIDAGCRNTGL